MIEVAHLTKQFGQLQAVADLSFAIRAGEAVALWGANGAGKTTVIHCLLNLMPFRGDILVNGLSVSANGKRVRQQIGFVPQELNFHNDLTVVETIRFYAQLKKIPAGHDFGPLLAQLDLAACLPKKIGSLSGGMKQRLALALALLADPPILLLDEPTANLDETGKQWVYSIIETYRQSNIVIIATNEPEEVVLATQRVDVT